MTNSIADSNEVGQPTNIHADPRIGQTTRPFSGVLRTNWGWLRGGAILAGLLGCSVGLAGCESGAALTGSGAVEPAAQLVPAKPTVAPTRLSMAPVIGAPDGISKQLSQNLVTALGQKNVVLVAAQDKADYTLRGYIVAVKDKSNVKVSYIWDVNDPSGRRVNRVTGEDMSPATAAGDPWASVTPQLSQALAQKSADSLASWFAAQTPVGVVASKQAPTQAPMAVAATAVSALPPSASTPVSHQASGGVSVALAAVVPSLTGAPGDGNSALARALQGELSKNGVNTDARGAAPSAYRVEGLVKVGAAAGGKQPVLIEWNVKDPQGKPLGTVRQKNEIEPGSLDQAWGRTADAAAAAAAQGILKLLPKRTASN